MFFVKFHNLDQYQIDIKMYDKSGNIKVAKSKVDPGYEYSHEAYFGQNFFFKRSATDKQLKASANGVTAELFEGCRFMAMGGRLMLVNVSDGKKPSTHQPYNQRIKYTNEILQRFIVHF